MGDPLDATLLETVSLLRAGKLSSRELTAASFTRIRQRDPVLQAWARIYEEDALVQAARADERLSVAGRRQQGRPHPLCGVPIGLKDVLAIGRKPLTGGSRALQDNIPSQDADAVRHLRAAGMVLLGHTKTQEFASGRSPQTAANPWNPRFSPGGSSNGSGSAVAGRTVGVALGTDTAGSLRRPASACGLSTVMGTYGSVSNRGIISTAPSYTQIGPLTGTASDAALVFSVLAAPEGYDPYRPDAGVAGSLRSGSINPTSGRKPLTGRRIGILENFEDAVVAPIGDLFDRFVSDLTELGANVVGVAAPAPSPAGVDPGPELVAFHRDLFPDRGHLYSSYQRDVVREALVKAPLVTAVDYHDAQRARSAYSHALADCLRERRVDAVVSPAQTNETPKRSKDPDNRDDLLGFGDVEIRRMWNTAGFPVVGVQIGMTPAGMPTGAQVAGTPWTEHILLQLAVDFQEHTDHHRRVPTGQSRS